MKNVRAKVVSFVDGGFVKVDSEELPSHLRPLYLRPSQFHGFRPEVGKDVELEYGGTSSCKLWNAIRELPCSVCGNSGWIPGIPEDEPCPKCNRKEA